MLKDASKTTGYPSIDKPWLKYYTEEAIYTPLPECTIYEYMYENNKAYPNDIAINYLGRNITYKELFERIDNTARAFQALDVQPGEIVTVALPSLPEAMYVIYALNRIGAIANMIHPLAGCKETTHYLNEVHSRVAVIFDGALDDIVNGIEETAVEKVIVVSPADSLPIILKLGYYLKNRPPRLDDRVFESWKSFIQKGLDTAIHEGKKDCNEVAIISHTGGTTGEPKAVMCSNQSINSLIWQIKHSLPVVRQERQIAVLPPFINYSLVNSMLEPIALGNTAILIPKYVPERFLDYVNKYKPTWVCSIPPYWEAMLNSGDRKKSDLSCIKYPIYGGEAMEPQLEERINEFLLAHRCPNVLAKGLGMTEIVSAATLTPFGQNKVNSVGRPFPRTNCCIVDPDTVNELPYGEEGEICFSGPTVMLGYYNQPKATEDIIRTDSYGVRWLHTGDLGYIDEDGFLYVTGRIKRIMITRGADGISTKMYPDRIEEVINSHPAVKICCVIGVPDVERVNYPKAFVELEEDSMQSSELSNEIKRFCRESLPEYLIPEVVEFVQALPRTDRGKIDYRKLEKLS